MGKLFGGFGRFLEAFTIFWGLLEAFWGGFGGGLLNFAIFVLLCAACCCIFAALVVFSVSVAVVVQEFPVEIVLWAL